MIHRILFAAAAAVLSVNAAACEISWDAPTDVGWIEGIRFYRDGTEIGVANPVPPVTCEAVNVQPCATCVYTATFYRGDKESAQSDPLAVSIKGVPQFGTITVQAQ